MSKRKLNLKRVGVWKIRRELFRQELREVPERRWGDGEQYFQPAHNERVAIPDGAEDVRVEVFIDVDDIASLVAWRAARTKSGRSTTQSGAVLAKVIDRKRANP